MKIDILSKEETHRTRNIDLNIQVEEAGKIHKLSVVMIEEYDNRYNKINYEIESFGWISGHPGVNARELETKISEYLVDNAVDILS